MIKDRPSLLVILVAHTSRSLFSATFFDMLMVYFQVTQEHSLNTAKRLHVSEKSWAKLANHFTILLSSNDADTLTRLQAFVDSWRDLMDEFNMRMYQREMEMIKTLNSVKNGIAGWTREFQRNIL